MKFAFSQSTDELEILFGKYNDVGYDGLQLKRNQYQPFLDEPQRFVDLYGDKAGAASGLIAGISSLKREDLERLEKIISFAVSANTQLVIICHCQPRHGLKKADLQQYARSFSEIGLKAKQRGVKLSLHHHYDQPVMYKEDFRVFFDSVRENSVGLTIDTAHLVKSGIENPATLIKEMAPFIDNFHIKDLNIKGEFRILGEGRIDFNPIFKAIKDIGYTGWVSADEESGADVLSAMEKCYRFLEKGLSMEKK